MPLPTLSRGLRSARTAGLALFALLAVAPAAHAFTLGFNDEDLVRYAGGRASNGPVDVNALNAALTNAHEAGATTWRLELNWSTIAPSAPPAASASDPAWAGYRWNYVDVMVRAITAAGMQPLLWVNRAPTWAEGADRPPVSKTVPIGVWKPSAPALSEFAKALAKRYSGGFPDPGNPAIALPKVTYFQGWNEPNLFTEIMPQWGKENGKTVVASVATFRDLLNGFYAGVKSVRTDAVVLAGGTAPFGGLTSADPRTPPARFYRELFCIRTSRGALVASKKCPKVKFDGWAHHTYPIGPPTRTARNKDDVVVPDMPKLTKIMAAAVKAKLVPKKSAKNIWMTEMSWETAPDPSGLSLADHALYMEAAFNVLWKAGVTHVLWWNARDDAQGSDWNATYQSGIFFRGTNPALDTRKPAWTAFHFPFTAYRAKGVASLWAKFPATGPVTVEAQNAAGAWSAVTTLKTGKDGTATGRIRVGPGTQLRATQAGQSSLAWKTF